MIWDICVGNVRKEADQHHRKSAKQSEPSAQDRKYKLSKKGG